MGVLSSFVGLSTKSAKVKFRPARRKFEIKRATPLVHVYAVCVGSQRRRQAGGKRGPVLGTAAGICQLIVLTFNQFTLQFFPPSMLLLLLLPAKLSKVFADGSHSLSRQ